MQARWTRSCRVLGLALWGLAASGQVLAQSAEQKLEAARQAIAEQALHQSTRVDAVSWIDAQGRLQEFQTYRQSSLTPAGAPAASVDLLRQAADTPCQRQGAARAAMAPVALQVQWPARMPQRTRERLQELITQTWLGSDSPRPWRMYAAASPLPAQASPYERLLVLPPSALPQWTLLLQFDPLPESSGELSHLGVRLSLQRSRPSSVLFEQRLELALEQRQLAWSVAEWKESAWQTIASQLQAWTPVLDQRLACEKVEPEIVATESGHWVLNMGSLAGLRVGDEWTLVNPAHLPERSMEPGALDQMVIARVSQVQAMRAHVRLVAGDARAPQPGWVARPLAAPAISEAPWPPRAGSAQQLARR